MAMKSIVREALDVFVCVEGRMNHVNMEDIIYVEHNSRTIFLYTVKGILYIPYTPLSEVQRILGGDYLFQCHKSYLVNRIYIERIDRTENYILLKDYLGTVAVGRKYKRRVLQKMHYVGADPER